MQVLDRSLDVIFGCCRLAFLVSGRKTVLKRQSVHVAVAEVPAGYF